jgi:hypothetical protein
VSNDSAVALSASAPAARLDPAGADDCIVRRPDGVYVDPGVPGPVLLAAFDALLRGGSYLVGLDYPVLLKALFDHGPALPRSPGGEPLVRLAAQVAPFDPERRALYRSAKISGGMAEYYFEPVYLPGAEDAPVRLDLDEFIADLWLKGIRFGVDVPTVRAAIASNQAGRVTVARRHEPEPGRDAHVVEVSEHLHRSDAPRQLANGKLDLLTFQNRFPQVPQGTRLLKKMPRTAGTPGFELSGIAIAPEVPKDLDLSAWCGAGTTVDRTGEGEFLVAQQAGFLSVDADGSKIAVTDKIVSRDGVSARTTGNLTLTGDYEEFGEVQEQRVVEGENITLHADVYGHVVSRGGLVLLNRNLVGGSATNKNGEIRVHGVASSAVIQASGAVVLERAENCVVSGARVRVAHAVNCEILGEDVDVGVAEGCAIGGMRVVVGSAAPRRQGEMTVIVMHPDCAAIVDALDQVGRRVAQFAELVAQHKAQVDQLAAEPGLRRYMLLATRVRKNEITLTPEQVPQFQKMAQAQAPALKAIAAASQQLKAIEAEHQAGLGVLAQLERQRAATSDPSCFVEVGAILGETQVRAWAYHADGTTLYDLPAREVKARVRGGLATTGLFSGSEGSFAWRSGEAGAEG